MTNVKIRNNWIITYNIKNIQLDKIRGIKKYEW